MRPGDEASQPQPLADPGRLKRYVDGVPVTVHEQVVMRYTKSGALVAGSAREVARGVVRDTFAGYDRLLAQYMAADPKATLLTPIAEQGVDLGDLARELGDGFSPLDLLAAAGFRSRSHPPRRTGRAAFPGVAALLAGHGAPAREVLEALVGKFVREGVDDLTGTGLLSVPPLANLGTPLEILSRFGGRDGYRAAVRALDAALFEATAPGPTA